MTLLLGTRKGLIVYKNSNNKWTFDKVHFKGIAVSIATADSNTGHWWACLDHGHWGVKLHRSKDEGKTWEELAAPKYPEGAMIKEGKPASNMYMWALENAGADKNGHLYIGTVPGGLFKSTNNGDTFELVESLWNHPSRNLWFGAGMDEAGIHSINVDPRNSDHIQVGISCGGTFQTKDGGKTWNPQNKGIVSTFLTNPTAEVGADPHLLVASKSNPDILWQQNHCGIYKSIDGGNNWTEVSGENKTAYFGFAIAINETNPDQVWVVPSKSDEQRVSVDEALVVCRTDDGGKTWQEFRNGLPQQNCFDIVYRHGLANKNNHLAFGSTCGNLFTSNDHGETWNCLNNYLPLIYSVKFA